MPQILTTANSNYHSGVSFTTNNLSRAGQGNSFYTVFPQHTDLKSNEAAGTVMQGNAGCAGYPVCPSYLPAQHCQQDSQTQIKVVPHVQM